MEPDQIDMMSPEELRGEIRRLISDNITMRTAIKRALADAESGNGWGPDVTICEYLNITNHWSRPKNRAAQFRR